VVAQQADALLTISRDIFQHAVLIDPLITATSVSETICNVMPNCTLGYLDHEQKVKANSIDRNKSRKAWSPKEVAELRRGVALHGEGNWQYIRQDASLRFHRKRSFTDLKDKWRNLKQHGEDKIPLVEAVVPTQVALQIPTVQPSLPTVPIAMALFMPPPSVNASLPPSSTSFSGNKSLELDMQQNLDDEFWDMLDEFN
jgi:hypothetical protein